jgi:hypothetical protein
MSIWQKTTIRDALLDEYKINKNRKQHKWAMKPKTDRVRLRSLISMRIG